MINLGCHLNVSTGETKRESLSREQSLPRVKKKEREKRGKKREKKREEEEEKEEMEKEMETDGDGEGEGEGEDRDGENTLLFKATQFGRGLLYRSSQNIKQPEDMR